MPKTDIIDQQELTRCGLSDKLAVQVQHMVAWWTLNSWYLGTFFKGKKRSPIVSFLDYIPEKTTERQMMEQGGKQNTFIEYTPTYI